MKSAGPNGSPSQRMFSTAKELLYRQRVIHQFPVDRDEVLCTLLPPEMQDYILSDGLESGGKTIRWENLTHCVNLGFTAVIEIDAETDNAFWFGWTGGHPAPVHPDKTFAMYESCPFYKEIVEWWGPAMETHKRLIQYEQALFAFLSRADHPLLVEKYWPELHTFVNYELLRNQKEPDMVKRRVVPMPTNDEAVGIIETLAGSTLLEKYKCNAWVGYDTEDW